MGLFQNELGVPGGYEEWLVGDEVQYKLAEYSAGSSVEFDAYEWDILERITNPRMDTIVRPERSQYTGRVALALYVRKDQVENRWGDSLHQLLGEHSLI